FFGDWVGGIPLRVHVRKLVRTARIQGVGRDRSQRDAVARRNVAINVETIQYTRPAWIEGQRLRGGRVITGNFARAAMELGSDGDGADLRLARVAADVSAGSSRPQGIQPLIVRAVQVQSEGEGALPVVVLGQAIWPFICRPMR